MNRSVVHVIRMHCCNYFIFSATILIWLATGIYGDKPCAARLIKGKSVVCVCNETYCDTITRLPPPPGKFVMYTSSQSGLRFSKAIGDLKPLNHESTTDPVVLKIKPDIKYQTIEGFGGSVTDSAGLNWKNLTDDLQKHLIDSYFSDNGLEYNMIRTPIGGSDFSTRPYAYNDKPVNDTRLTNFTFTYEDVHYKLPMIKAAMVAATQPIHVVATTWSPPIWMKTMPQYTHAGFLKPEYYQTYAEYHKKFIELYSKVGVPIWGLTTTNEPSDCLMAISPLNCLGWTASTLGKWISENLGPTIRNSTYNNTKILSGDDQRITLTYWFNTLVYEHPKALDYIDGVSVHYYTDHIVPAIVFDEVTHFYPQKFIIATEACEGFLPWQVKVDFGSWLRARNYAQDIMEDLTHNLVGWIDWNLCLNMEGGPNWVKNYVDSPIIVFPERKAFIKQPMFYAMGHYSKFIPRGSRRIEVAKKHFIFKKTNVESVGFLTPRNTVVVVLYNDGPPTDVIIKLDDRQADFKIENDAIATFEILYHE